MMEKTFSHQGVSATVFTATGWSASDKRVIYQKLTQAGHNLQQDVTARRAVTFAQMLTQSKDVTGLPFDFPAPSDSFEVIGKAFEAVNGLHGALVGMWILNLEDVDTPPTAKPELTPDADPKADASPTLRQSAAD